MSDSTLDLIAPQEGDVTQELQEIAKYEEDNIYSEYELSKKNWEQTLMMQVDVSNL